MLQDIIFNFVKSNIVVYGFRKQQFCCMRISLERILLKEKIINLPNFISFSRLIFLPFFIISSKEYYFSSYSIKYYIHSILSLSLIYLSDYLDGLIARKTQSETIFGKYLDPVCDKIVGVLSFLVLVRFFQLPVWILVYIFSREIVGSYFGYYLFYKKNIQGKPNIYGKWSVALSGFINYYYLSLPLILQNRSFLVDIPLLVYLAVNIKSNWEYFKNWSELNARRGT